MIEVYSEVEMATSSSDFVEKQFTGTEPPRCVDGRPAPGSEQGPQMLGGSLHPIILSSIYHSQDFTKESVAASIKSLKENGVAIGVHRGSHRNEDSSDCGFADRMPDIVKTAVERQDIITSRLNQIYQDNQHNFPPIPFSDLVEKAYQKIIGYDPNRINIRGEDLITLVEQQGSTSQIVQGDHQEEAAFVNIKQNITLDTQSLNAKKKQAFNLDLSPAVSQAQKLGVPENFSIAASLILYTATEMVLVEDKGKPALPVLVKI